MKTTSTKKVLSQSTKQTQAKTPKPQTTTKPISKSKSVPLSVNEINSKLFGNIIKDQSENNKKMASAFNWLYC